MIVLHGCGGFGEIDHRLTAELPRRLLRADAAAGKDGLLQRVRRVRLRVPRLGAHRGERSRRVARARRAPSRDRRLVDGRGLALASAAEVGGFDALAVLSAFAHDVGNAAALPPTIVLSGGRGDAVPVSEAVALHRALVDAHVPTELHVYPHGNHQWKGRQGDAAIRWIGMFLRKHLL